MKMESLRLSDGDQHELHEEIVQFSEGQDLAGNPFLIFSGPRARIEIRVRSCLGNTFEVVAKVRGFEWKPIMKPMVENKGTQERSLWVMAVEVLETYFQNFLFEGEITRCLPVRVGEGEITQMEGEEDVPINLYVQTRHGGWLSQESFYTLEKMVTRFLGWIVVSPNPLFLMDRTNLPLV